MNQLITAVEPIDPLPLAEAVWQDLWAVSVIRETTGQLRDIVPKDMSLQGHPKEHMTLITNHIIGHVRKRLGGLRPVDVAINALP